MRGITFALLIAFVGCQNDDFELEFSNKKAYIYRYEGLILNGLSDRDIKKSGLKLTCQVRISRITDDEHILKVISPRMDEFFGIWPKDWFIEAPKLTQQIGLCFTHWYKFDYQRGHIRNIYAPKDVPLLCVNIVKGILNLLPLSIKKSQSLYEVEEERIEGTCNTKYIIQEEREKNQTTILQTRDLDNCTNKIVKNIGMAYVRPCPTCPVQAGNTRSTMTIIQKLKYKETGVFIMYAESQQLYELAPFNEPDGTAVMEARQNLTFIETKDNEPITTIQLKYYGNLNYQFSEDLPQMALHLIKPKSIEARFAEILQQLIMQQKNQSQIQVKTPPNFLELIELSRMATLENLESLWKQFGNRQEFRCWFLSAVAAAGTTNTFMFLKQRIQNEELSVMGSAITLVLAFHLTKPDNLTVTAAADLLADHKVQKSLLLHRLSYLGYGSMVNKYCSTFSTCPAHILQPLHVLAANRSNEEDIILALKAIGNAGEPASIKIIKRFLPALSPATNISSFLVHGNAVFSLRKIARKAPAKVQEIVFQIFLDRSLQPTVRMMACLVFFETKPHLSLVLSMANFLQNETSVQVENFVYSHMEVLSGGGIPQLYNLATACRIALKLLGPRFHQRSFRYSTVMEIKDYNSDSWAGAIGRVYLMQDDKLPPSFMTKIRGYYASSAMDIVEAGVLFKSQPDLTTEQVKQFAYRKQLHMLGRLLKEWKGLRVENIPLRAYIKLYSHEIIFGKIDEEFQELVEHLTKPEEMKKWVKEMIPPLQIGFSGNMIHPLWAAEIRHIVPTAVGFPLEFGLYSTSIMHAAAKVKGHVPPPPMENFRPEKLLESDLQLSADINASLYTDVVATMGINTPCFQNGLEFHASFNVSMSMKFYAELDIINENFKFETIPAQEETQLLAIRTKLYAISRNIDEPDSNKMFPVLPEVPGPDIPNEQWKPSQSERNFKDVGIMFSRDYDMTFNASDPEEEHHNQENKTKCLKVFCYKLFGYQTCLTMKSCNAILRKTHLDALVEERDFRLTAKSESPEMKILLEIQGGVDPKATFLGQSEGNSAVNLMTNQTNTTEHQQIGEHDQCSPMTESKPTGFVAIFRTINGEVLTRVIRAVLRADLHSSKPTVQVQVVISGLKEPRTTKICADLAILDSQTAEGTLKWGLDCQEYKIATQVAYGQYNYHPAMQIKFEWATIPSEVQAAARWLLKFLPGIVYEHGLVQKDQKNPPQEASVVAALTSPQTCDLILRLPNVTIYDTDMMLPFTIPIGQYTETSAMPPHAWNFISKVPLSVFENLKARCTITKDSVTTFNGVRFNYSIPPKVYHILIQDCSSELKFIVMAKHTKEPDELRSIHLTVGYHEIDMYTSNGLVKVMVNGTEIPEEDLPYSSKSGDILISRERNGLLLNAPKAGIDALYYDGHVLETKIGYKMNGKTCGICGRNDAEYKQEYKMPNGSVARDAMSFVQSWTIDEDAYNRAKAQISLA